MLAPSARLERANLLVRNQTLYPLSYEGIHNYGSNYTTNLLFFQVMVMLKRQVLGALWDRYTLLVRNVLVFGVGTRKRVLIHTRFFT